MLRQSTWNGRFGTLPILREKFTVCNLASFLRAVTTHCIVNVPVLGDVNWFGRQGLYRSLLLPTLWLFSLLLRSDCLESQK